MHHAGMSAAARRLCTFFAATALTLGAGAALCSPSFAKAKKPRATNAGKVTSTNWGTVPANAATTAQGTAGQTVKLYTLSNHKRMSVRIITYGADVQAINVPDRRGKVKDVVLGFPDLTSYVDDFTQGAVGGLTGDPSYAWPAPGGAGDTYFGGLIGRYANRIADHSFTMSCTGCDNNGKTYTLDANNDTTDTLHGGYLGWNTAIWSATSKVTKGNVQVAMSHTFPANEGCLVVSSTCTGFPAAVTVTVTYTLSRSSAFGIHYSITNNSAPGGDATVVNVTSHDYFNLGGQASGTVYNQELAINSNTYQPANAAQIPVGFVPVKGTPFDFRTLHKIGKNLTNGSLPDGGGQSLTQLQLAHGYDFNWVLRGNPSAKKLAALAYDPATGISLKTYTDQPGIQVYTSNYLDGDLAGIGGTLYRQGAAFTLETQHYPDAPHHIGQANWPSVVLEPASTFKTTTTFQFGVAKKNWNRKARF